jgi:hypothetical protein
VNLGSASRGLDEDAVYARCLPLVGLTREEAERRVRAVIGTRPAATDDLRQVAALFGLAVYRPGAAERGPESAAS